MNLIVVLFFYVSCVYSSCVDCQGVCCFSSSLRKGPAEVDLGTSADFAVLSKAGVSRTGTGVITGNVGCSPIAQGALTGFSQTMDSSNVFSKSDYVKSGNLYAADYASPTPSVLTTAVSDMETAFTNAAGRTIPTATELGAGDISGMTLAAGLYKWSSGLYIDGTGVSLSGGTNDVWIFQIAQNLIFASSSSVTLKAGAQAKNIFWQVKGFVQAGTTSSISGNLLSATAVILQTGSTLNGRALCQTHATMDGLAVTIPSTAAQVDKCCSNGTLCNSLNGLCYPSSNYGDQVNSSCADQVENCLWCEIDQMSICETCDSGYFVNAGICPAVMCYGHYSNDSSVCNGQGNCTQTNICVCEGNYSGLECYPLNQIASVQEDGCTSFKKYSVILVVIFFGLIT